MIFHPHNYLNEEINQTLFSRDKQGLALFNLKKQRQLIMHYAL